MDKNMILQKYLGDMHALESHIYQAIDKQVKETKENPDINSMLQKYRDTLDQHRKALEQRVQAMGGSASHPIKELGASLLGVGAGIIDALRAEEVSKDLRDDYTAINHAIISYVMLHTTALALGDQETAQLAQRHLSDNAQFVMELQQVIPQWVVNDLRDDAPDLDATAVDQTRQAVSEVWRQQKQG